MKLTIISMLKTLQEVHKYKSKDHIHKLVFTYNCTKYSHTGYTPYFLPFGRHPKLPREIILPTNRQVKENMKEAQKLVSKQ